MVVGRTLKSARLLANTCGATPAARSAALTETTCTWLVPDVPATANIFRVNTTASALYPKLPG
jgi:hypothetical protein